MAEPAHLVSPGERRSEGAGSTRIVLRDIAVEAIVGVYAHERMQARPLTISVRVEIERVPSEILSDTLDYRSILDVVVRTAGESCVLIESLAQRIGERLVENPIVVRVDVEVEKPGAVTNGVAGVHFSVLAPRFISSHVK